jgi:hypothetical protein
MPEQTREQLIEEAAREIDEAVRNSYDWHDKPAPNIRAILSRALTATEQRVREDMETRVRDVMEFVQLHGVGPFGETLEQAVLNQIAIATPAAPQEDSGGGETRCRWTWDRDYEWWEASCGEAWCQDGTPPENHYRFCPGCGKPIVIVEPESEEDEEPSCPECGGTGYVRSRDDDTGEDQTWPCPECATPPTAEERREP